MTTLDQLPDKASQLMSVIEEMHAGGRVWITRAELAERTNKNQLNPIELTHMDYLTRLGFLEARRETGTLSYQYRINENARRANDGHSARHTSSARKND